MTQKISEYFNIPEKTLDKMGVFNAVIGIDTHLFLDPQLLKKTKIPELKSSRQRFEKYFSDIMKLLVASRKTGDVAWREARKRLIFRELRGVSIGYGTQGGDGKGVGPELGFKLLNTASEIIGMGIKDPAIFELLGLFEEGFGADRFSDMTISIIRDDLFKFSERVAKTLNLKKLIEVKRNGNIYHLPLHPDKNKVLVFLPKEQLRDLPMAFSREDIDYVVSVNRELRNRINELVGKTWGKKTRIPKRDLKELIFKDKNNLIKLLQSYKERDIKTYDFINDPAGEVIWYDLGRKFANENEIKLKISSTPTIDDVEKVVLDIILQFKKNIEVNGLKEHLYTKDGNLYKPRHERFSQLLFYSTADTYCGANNLDLNREPNAGNGPVDFKVSSGYKSRVLVEIKLSSNKSLIHGFEKQLQAYQESESTQKSIYVIIQLTKSANQIKRVLRLKEKADKEKKRVPAIIIIDGTIKPSASKR